MSGGVSVTPSSTGSGRTLSLDINGTQIAAVAALVAGCVALISMVVAVVRDANNRRAAMRRGFYIALIVGVVITLPLSLFFLERPPTAFAFQYASPDVGWLSAIPLCAFVLPYVVRGLIQYYRNNGCRRNNVHYIRSPECREMIPPSLVGGLVCLSACVLVVYLYPLPTPRAGTPCVATNTSTPVDTANCGAFMCDVVTQTCQSVCDIDAECMPGAVCYLDMCTAIVTEPTGRYFAPWVATTVSVSLGAVLFEGVLSLEFMHNAFGVIFSLATTAGTIALPMILAHNAFAPFIAVVYIIPIAVGSGFIAGIGSLLLAKRIRRPAAQPGAFPPAAAAPVAVPGAAAVAAGAPANPAVQPPRGEATLLGLGTCMFVTIAVSLSIGLILGVMGIAPTPPPLTVSDVPCIFATDTACAPYICDMTQSHCYGTCNADAQCNLTSICVDGACKELGHARAPIFVPVMPWFWSILIAVGAGLIMFMCCCCIGWYRAQYQKTRWHVVSIVAVVACLVVMAAVALPLSFTRQPVQPLDVGNGTTCSSSMDPSCTPYFCDMSVGRCFQWCSQFDECFQTWMCDTSEHRCVPQPPAYEDHKLGDEPVYIGGGAIVLLALLACTAIFLCCIIERRNRPPPAVVHMVREVEVYSGLGFLGINRGANERTHLLPPLGETPMTPPTPAPGGTPQREDCIICRAAPIDTIVLHCGHACMCQACANMLVAQATPVCPMCRGAIQSRQGIRRIFYSDA